MRQQWVQRSSRISSIRCVHCGEVLRRWLQGGESCMWELRRRDWKSVTSSVPTHFSDTPLSTHTHTPTHTCNMETCTCIKLYKGRILTNVFIFGLSRMARYLHIFAYDVLKWLYWIGKLVDVLTECTTTKTNSCSKWFSTSFPSMTNSATEKPHNIT